MASAGANTLRLVEVLSSKWASRGGALACLIACVLFTALPVAVVLADADPPSDVLLTQDYYVPYQPEMSTNMVVALRRLLDESRAAGYPILVAIVASTLDLGAVPDLFGQPRRYATFLGQELALGQQGGAGNQLLAIMPHGVGYAGPASATADRLIAQPVNVTNGTAVDSDAMAQIVGRDVVALAAASGHPIKDVPGPFTPGGSSGATGGGGGGSGTIVIIIVLVALVALIGVAVVLRLRAARAGAGPDPVK